MFLFRLWLRGALNIRGFGHDPVLLCPNENHSKMAQFGVDRPSPMPGLAATGRMCSAVRNRDFVACQSSKTVAQRLPRMLHGADHARPALSRQYASHSSETPLPLGRVELRRIALAKCVQLRADQWWQARAGGASRWRRRRRAQSPAPRSRPILYSGIYTPLRLGRDPKQLSPEFIGTKFISCDQISNVPL